MSTSMNDQSRIAIVGLGYVGLPLAVEFSKKYETIGYDTSMSRIQELSRGFDNTNELTSQELSSASNISFTNLVDNIKESNIYIITVPTPISNNNEPDLSMIESATIDIASVLREGDIIIYESTVYPGLTEEICVPLLEKESGLKYNKDFFCGYSPERINPGDKEHNVTNIVKVTSGSNHDVAQKIDSLYKSIIKAGTYLAPSIKVAEMAKVIENTQRDVNIALINEFAQICSKLDIDTEEVLKASETKWNFISFRPGLVGGHCIGVDPYYLTYKCEELGHKPEVILSGRVLNDNMHKFIVSDVISNANDKNIDTSELKVLIMGFTFKENCPDYRNSRSFHLMEEFEKKNCIVDVFDPWIDSEKINAEYNFIPVQKPKNNYYDVIIITIAHDEFLRMGKDKISNLGKDNHLLYDMKYIFNSDEVDARL